MTGYPRKYVFWVLAVGMGLLMAACGERPEAEGFMAPELGGCVVRTDGYTATISWTSI